MPINQLFFQGKKLFVSAKDRLADKSVPTHINLQDAFRQIERYENTRNGLITYDAAGKPRTITGLLPDGQTGIEILDATGQIRTRVGTQADGTQALTFYDPSGILRSRFGTLADGTQGATFFDVAGNPRVRIGTLASGDQGLAVYDLNGANPQEILPVSVNAVGTTLTTQSTTFVDLGGPQVTAVIGASGDAIITASSFITSTATNQSAAVGISVDGAAPTATILQLTNNSGGSLGVSCAMDRTLSQSSIGTLTPGSHTFKLWFKQTLAATNASFALSVITARPV